MFDTPIQKMDFKQLRNAVQVLTDEIAILKRKYEDAIYNLDSDNFSKGFTIEQNNMKAQVKVTAEAIKTMVSYNDLENTLSEYSTIEQTAQTITSTVTGEYVETLIGDTYVTNAFLQSEIKQSADSIMMTVEETYEDRVTGLENFKTSVFTQTADGFTLDGEQTTFTGVIYLTDNNGNKKFAFTHDESNSLNPIITFRGIDSTKSPIVIGEYSAGSPNVYIGGTALSDKVATHGWVEENCIAKFG